MGTRYFRVFLWTAPVVLVNLVLLAIVPTVPTNNLIESMAQQALGGTVFAQTAIAATWAAFGPGPFMWRLPLSLTWLALLTVAIGISGVLHEGSSEDFVIVGMLLLSQWLLLQFPLWAAAIGFGIQLRHADEIESESAASQTQFGIRQLMLVTAIVAVLLGIGRIAIPPVVEQEGFIQQVGPILVFLAVAEVAITFPLVLAALLRRRAFVGVMLALGLIVVVTICEIPLMRMASAGGSSSILQVVALNFGTVAWMVIVLSIVRSNGYSLTRTQVPAKA